MKAVSVTVDPTRRLGPVNRAAFGQNAEWLSWTAPQLWADGRVRDDVVEAIKAIGATSLRFPSGCLADYYDWRTAIGPRDQRPALPNPYAIETVEPWLGSDELVDLCERTGATAWMQTNPVSGTPDDTVEWSRYLESLGCPAPHWELGNEGYIANPDDHDPVSPNNSRISMPAAEYVRRAGAQARALRAASPGVSIGAIVGPFGDGIVNPFHPDWNDRVLDDLGKDVDFISVHGAYGPGDWIPGWWDRQTPGTLAHVHRAAAAFPVVVKARLRETAALLDAHGLPDVDIALTEWLPFYGAAAEASLLCGTMGAAVMTAGMLNLLLVEPRLFAAHFTSFVQPTWGACITIDEGGFHLSANGEVMGLYAQNLGPTHVDASVVTDTFDCDGQGETAVIRGVPTVDALATAGSAGEVALFLVNRDQESPRTASLELKNGNAAARISAVTVAGGPFDCNGPLPISTDLIRARAADDPLRPRPIPVAGQGPHSVELPPCSVTLVRWQKAG